MLVQRIQTGSRVIRAVSGKSNFRMKLNSVIFLFSFDQLYSAKLTQEVTRSRSFNFVNHYTMKFF